VVVVALVTLGPLALAAEDGAQASRRVVETVLVKVNDEIITQSSFDRSFAPVDGQLQEKFKDDPAKLMAERPVRRKAFLENMVDNLLLTQRARSLGIKVGEDEVREVIDRLMLENGLKAQEDLVLALKSEGIDFEEFKSDLRSQGHREKLISQEILRKITVSDVEVTTYYEDHLDQFAIPARVHLREIGLGSDRATAGELQAKAAAEIRSGKAFEKVAEELSLSPSREKGGDLGWFAKGDLDPAVEEALVGLKAGATTGLVASSYGFHVFQVEERQEAGRRTLDEVRGAVEERLRKSKYDEDLKAMLRKLRDDADIRYKNEKGVLVEAKSLEKATSAS
jgi:parvulin-like peptidyl-prolyl isomerase